MTTEQERIKEFFCEFAKSALLGKDLDIIMSFVSEDILGVGMGEQGLVFNKEEARAVLSEIKVMENASYDINFEKMEVRYYPPCFANVCAIIRVNCEIGSDVKSSAIIQFASMIKENDEWKICALQATPVEVTEESISAYPIKFAENTIAQLRSELQVEAIKLMNQSIPGGVMSAYVETDYPIYFINDGMLERLGYTREEFMIASGGTCIGCVHEEDVEYVKNKIEIALKEETNLEFQYRIMKKDNSYLWMLGRGRVAYDEIGRKVIITVNVDITEIINLQEELETLTNNVPGGVCTLRMDGMLTILYGNTFFYDLYGYTNKQILMELDNKWIRCIHNDDVKMVTDTLFRAYKENIKVFEFETRAVKRDGEIIWVMIRGGYIAKSDDICIHCVTLDITERKKMEQALKLSEERFRIALEKTSNIIFDYDILSGVIIHSSIPKKTFDFTVDVNDAANSLILGGIIVPECIDIFLESFEEIRCGKNQSECIVKARLTDGGEVWNKISMTAITDDLGRPVRAIGMIEDITREKEAELAYAREEQYRSAVLSEAMATYAINFTKNQFESCRVNNPICVTTREGEPYNEFIKKVAENRFSTSDAQAYINLFSTNHVMEAFKKNEHELKLQYRLLNFDKTYMWMQTNLRLMLDTTTNDMKGFMYVLDIDKEKIEDLQLTYNSEHDQMTGAYNKGATVSYIRELLKTTDGIETGVFMMIDVDHFKDINDTYGHPFGDKVLIDAARGIRDSFRENDIIGRLGGDEFCVFFCGIRSRKRIEGAANTICDVFRKIFVPKDENYNPSCSIGIACCNGSAKTFEQVYKEADIALYKVKRKGRDGYAFFDGG